MRRKGFWKIETVLLLSLSLVPPALAAESEDDGPKAALKEPGSSHWYSKWFSSAPKEANKKAGPVEKAVEKKSVSESNLVPAPAPAPDEQSAHARANFLRRLGVCLQIKEVAEQTNDEALKQQAEQLDQKVWEAYSRQMGGSQCAEAMNPLGPSLSDKTLEKEKAGKVDAGLSANTAGKSERNSHSAIREEVP